MMKLRWYLTVALLVAPSSGDDGDSKEPAYTLQIRPVKRIEATLTHSYRAPELSAREWIFYAPEAPGLAGQQAHSTRLSPEGRASRELSAAGRPMMLGRVVSDGSLYGNAITFEARYDVTLKSRKLVKLASGEQAPAVPPLSAKEKQTALAATGCCNWQSAEFREWLAKAELKRKPGEADVDLGRRVFLFIKKNFQYEYTSNLNRRASRVCKAGKSDCGGLSALFVSAMRANGVAARQLVGRWAIPAKSGEKVGEIAYTQQHAKAEFFAEGVGWVPVDLACAVLYDKTPTGLRFFGNDPGDFVTLHIDDSVILNSFYFGHHTVESLQSGTMWVMGEGTTTNLTDSVDWQVKSSPLVEDTTSSRPQREIPKP